MFTASDTFLAISLAAVQGVSIQGRQETENSYSNWHRRWRNSGSPITRGPEAGAIATGTGCEGSSSAFLRIGWFSFLYMLVILGLVAIPGLIAILDIILEAEKYPAPQQIAPSDFITHQSMAIDHLQLVDINGIDNKP